MEQRCICEHAVEVTGRQIQLEKTLLQDLASTERTRHRGELRRTLQSCHKMPEPLQCLEIPSRPAPEIQYRERWGRLDVLQKCRDILIDIVITRGLPEGFRSLVVVPQRHRGDAFKVIR